MKFPLHSKGIFRRQLGLRAVSLVIMGMVVVVGMLISRNLHKQFIPGIQRLSPRCQAILLHEPGLLEAIQCVTESGSLHKGRFMPPGCLCKARVLVGTRHGTEQQDGATCA